MYDQKPWLQHYGTVPKELTATPRPLYDVVVRWKDQDQRVAVVTEKQQITYPRLWDMIRKVAEGLRQAGIKRGDRVAILLPNSLAFLQAYFGVLLLNATVVALNPLYTASELGTLLRDAGPKALIVPPELIQRLPPESLPLPWGVIIASPENNEEIEREVQKLYPQAELLTQWLKLSAIPEEGIEPVDPIRDIALIQYTGGTTGLPKGAMLSHWNLLANAEQSRLWMQGLLSSDQDAMLIALPLFHAYGMTAGMNLGLLIGSRLVFMVRFHPESAASWIEKTRITLFPGAPTMYVALSQYAEAHNLDLTSIKGCLSGSAPLPRQVQEGFQKLTGGRIVEGYGLTEASPVTHCQPLWPVDHETLGIGLPYPSTQVRIVDDEGREVPVGEAGELIVQGPQVMQGYWQRPQETRDALRQGWLYTGDLAKMDEEGYFTIQERKKDLIICSGFNVYPREVEEVLYRCPGIQEVSVVGIPDPYRGESVRAYLVPRSGAKLELQDIDHFCQQHLASYKRPRSYRIVDQLPKSAIGKILRRELARQAAADLDDSPKR